MKIKEMPKDSKPRERFIKYGPEALSDAELFAIILRTGTKQENVLEVANKLISEKGIDKLFNCSIKELREIKGIGNTKAIELLTIAELAKRYNNYKREIKKITCAQDVFDLFHDRLRDEKQENFIVLCLNGRHQIIKEEVVSKGILDASIIHPREIFKIAVKESAYAVVFVHNHPSGDINPSQEDLKIAKILNKSGEILGIPVLDQIIIGKEGYWSIRENKIN